MRCSHCIIALAVVVATAPATAMASDLLLPRRDGSYERQALPGTQPGERLDVRPVPGTGSAAVYENRGSRVGTVESKPYGGAAFYDERGRRRSP